MVVIVGAGIVGAATAYYLSASGVGDITILDAAKPAAGSSGRAGAFLTNCPPSFRRGVGKSSDKRRFLFEKSFDLHEQLAKELELESFCRVQNYQTIEAKDATGGNIGEVKSTDNESFRGDSQQSILGHLVENGIGTPLSGDAALVDPAELVASMMDRVLSKSNCSFRQENVSGLKVDASGSCVTEIEFESNAVLQLQEDEAVVIALGPWSSRIEDWLGIPMPIEGVLSTSLIYQDGIPNKDVGTAFFFDEDSNGCHLEVFGRCDKSLYVSGCGESQIIGTQQLRSDQRPSPITPCAPDATRAAAAHTSLRNAGYNQHLNPSIVQACIRPMSPDGVPVVGKLLGNVYVATGGGPWGITWGPLMGQSLACLILGDDDENPPVRLGPLSPKRFDTFVYKSLLKSRSSDNN